MGKEGMKEHTLERVNQEGKERESLGGFLKCSESRATATGLVEADSEMMVDVVCCLDVIRRLRQRGGGGWMAVGSQV